MARKRDLTASAAITITRSGSLFVLQLAEDPHDPEATLYRRALTSGEFAQLARAVEAHRAPAAAPSPNAAGGAPLTPPYVVTFTAIDVTPPLAQPEAACGVLRQEIQGWAFTTERRARETFLSLHYERSLLPEAQRNCYRIIIPPADQCGLDLNQVAHDPHADQVRAAWFRMLRAQFRADPARGGGEAYWRSVVASRGAAFVAGLDR